MKTKKLQWLLTIVVFAVAFSMNGCSKDDPVKDKGESSQSKLYGFGDSEELKFYGMFEIDKTSGALTPVSWCPTIMVYPVIDYEKRTAIGFDYGNAGELELMDICFVDFNTRQQTIIKHEDVGNYINFVSIQNNWYVIMQDKDNAHLSLYEFDLINKKPTTQISSIEIPKEFFYDGRGNYQPFVYDKSTQSLNW